LRLFLLLSILLSGLFSWAQPPEKIDYTSDRTQKDEARFPNALLFSKVDKQVKFNHQGIDVYCDKAIFYQDENYFKAYGNVKMNQGDTIRMNSEYAEYNGNNQKAFASGDVVLNTPDNTLTTDTLYFNRIKQESYYDSGGKVRDTSSTITSRIGRYYMKDKKYVFRRNVVVQHPEYLLETQHLTYYPESESAYLFGPSTITGEESKIYCERGFYQLKQNYGYFIKNSRIDYKNRKLEGDSIYFDRNRGFASATNHIKVTDTINQSITKGHYAELYRKKDSLLITKNPLVSALEEKDSVHLASDTLVVTGKADQRIVRAYHDARILRAQMSGKSDSIWSSEETGLTKMITRPVLWSENSQITGDTIHLKSDVEAEKLDSLIVFNHSLVVQQDSLGKFNQIKGKRLYGLFKNNQLHQIDIVKNAESIYYMRNDESDLIGIDKSYGSTITAIIEDNGIKEVTYYDRADSKTYPKKDLPPNARKVKGFIWRGEEQIFTKADLLTGRPEFDLPKIQGLDPPDNEIDFFDDKKMKSDYLNDTDQEGADKPSASSVPSDTLVDQKKTKSLKLPKQ
ncbi:MAG: OstA-like protein, partial [Psychroflexus sp.]|nr:OstA-like protein [Psychroflexus sp.]